MQAKCRATTRAGEPCGNRPVLGAAVCRMHGGSAGQVKAAAARRRQQEQVQQVLIALGEPEAIDPAQALLNLISWKYGEVKWLRAKVQELPEEDLTWGRSQTDVKIGRDGQVDTETKKAAPSLWWALLRTAEDQLADNAARALRSGVEERRVRLAEQQADLVVQAMMAIFRRLKLTPLQWDLVHIVAPEELRRLGGE